MTTRVPGKAVLLAALLLAGCEDPNMPPKKPTYLDLERTYVVNELPWAEGSAGGATLDERRAHHGVGSLVIALIDGGEPRLLVPSGERAGTTIQADATFDASPLSDLPLALGALRFAQQQETMPADPLAALQAAQGPRLAEWLNTEILAPAKLQSRLQDAENGFAWRATAAELATLVVDLQKAAAGRPARRLAQPAARLLLTPGAVPTLGERLQVAGRGQGVHFGLRGQNAEGSALLVAYASSGQGAVILTDSPQGLALSDEIAAALAHRYNWPARQEEGSLACCLSCRAPRTQRLLFMTAADRFSAPPTPLMSAGWSGGAPVDRGATSRQTGVVVRKPFSLRSTNEYCQLSWMATKRSRG